MTKNPTLSHAAPVISEMPYESFAHRPVEVLPLVCPGDQRKAAQLQVRWRTTTLVDTSATLQSLSFLFFFTFFLLFFSQREDGPGV